MDINRNNYETFFLLYLDRELNPAERIEVESFLNEHADLQKEFSLLQHTIQWPAETVFEPKELLYRREEKRRIIPVYWTRIAAALTLILAGSWFTLAILKNHKAVISGNEQSLSAIDVRKNHPNVDAAIKPNPEKQEGNTGNDAFQGTNTQRDLKKNPDDSGLGTNRSLANNTNPGKTTAVIGIQNKKKTGDQLSPSVEQQDASGEAVIVMQKSGTSPDLQTSGNRNAEIVPGKLPDGTKTPSLAIAVAGKNLPTDIENEQLTDIQTDNAISVIALNDRNKGITGFFKKLTKRAPGDETAANTKKLRVSVFQISY